MKSEIYKAINGINITLLTQEDLSDLLVLFRHTKNTMVRDRLSFIFSDLNFKDSIPEILEKINAPENYNNNGSLVYALSEMNTTNEFIDFVKIISEQGMRQGKWHTRRCAETLTKSQRRPNRRA